MMLRRFFENFTAGTSILQLVIHRKVTCKVINHKMDAMNGYIERQFINDFCKPKPPAILVYTNNNDEEYKTLYGMLYKVLPLDTFSFFHISSKALANEPWVDDNIACMIFTDVESLGNGSHGKIQEYFRRAGKILFITSNIAKNLEGGANEPILKALLGERVVGFGSFASKMLPSINESAESKKEEYNADGYDVILEKEKGQPLTCLIKNSDTDSVVLFCASSVNDLTSNSILSSILRKLQMPVVENHDVPDLTYGYFVCDPDKLTWEMEGLSYDEELGSEPKLFFQTAEKFNEETTKPSTSLLPIKVCRRKLGFSEEDVDFDVDEYYKGLQTKRLAKALLYIPVTSTTMTISKSLRQALPSFDGIVVVAGAQIAGYGRSGNQWIAAEGSALFSFNYNLPLDSNLGQAATYIQLILAVSIVDAIQTLLEDSTFPIKIKWPNDIYYNRQYKLGGILVTSSINGGIMQCIIGAGINVGNSMPTVCINDLIPSDSDKLLTVEEVIAEIMNKFEHYVNVFENQGRQHFLRSYYNFWLHSNEEVEIIQEGNPNEKEKVKILGLDEYGYLQVQNLQTKTIFTVHDDGNTFDMMKGLIRPKTR